MVSSRLAEIISKNSQETKKIGRVLAGGIFNWRLGDKEALIIALEGELGAGKTTFAQGLAKGFKIKEKITSPTFVILKKFNLKDSFWQNLYHIDCYRVNSPQDILDLDFKEITSRPKNIVVIEWAEKIKSILPKEKVLWVSFSYLEKNERKLSINLII